VPRLLPWLDERKPDVVCLQETKLADAAFTDLLGGELAERGYEVALHGEPAWNGVADPLACRARGRRRGDRGRGRGSRSRRRARSAATCSGVRVVSVYVPNGRTPDSEH